MKVSNINPYYSAKSISKIKHTKPISFTSIQKTKAPEVSKFKKMVLQIQARMFEKQGKNAVENSKEIAAFALDRQEFMADKIKQANDIKADANAAYYSAIADFAGMNIFSLSQVDEKTGKLIKEIVVENPDEKTIKRTVEKAHDAFIMTDYRQNGTRREVVLKKNATVVREIAVDKNKIKVYAFDDGGNLLAFAKNPKFKNGAYTAEERFKYDGGNLAIWETYITVIADEGIEKAFQRAEFQDDKLIGYSEDWSKSSENIIRAKEYYLFKDSILHDYLENYQTTTSLDDGFSASLMLEMTSDKKVSYFAQDVDLNIYACGYFRKYFEYGENNNLKYVMLGTDVVEDGMEADKIFEANKNSEFIKCHFNAKLNGLGQINSDKEVEL